MALALPQSPRVKVFREIVSILRSDPTLCRVIRKDCLRAWSGDVADAKAFSIEHAPALRLTPATTGDQFVTPDSMAGDLLINCEILLRGNDADDLFNFWWAICRAIYPTDPIQRSQIALQLQNAGARSGLVLFSQPAFDPDPDGVFFAGMGQMKIAIEAVYN